MASYYYLMASLPMLKSDGEMPLDYASFVDACKDCVSKSKLEILENLSVESDKGPLVSEWAKFYGDFKAELTHQRSARLGRECPAPDVRDEKIIKAVTAAIGDKNPLSAENALLAFQFEKLDELVGTHTFDDHALMGYALKLKLLERKTVFDAQKGTAEFNRLVDVLTKRISGMEQE